MLEGSSVLAALIAKSGKQKQDKLRGVHDALARSSKDKTYCMEALALKQMVVRRAGLL